MPRVFRWWVSSAANPGFPWEAEGSTCTKPQAIRAWRRLGPTTQRLLPARGETAENNPCLAALGTHHPFFSPKGFGLTGLVERHPPRRRYFGALALALPCACRSTASTCAQSRAQDSCSAGGSLASRAASRMPARSLSRCQSCRRALQSCGPAACPLQMLGPQGEVGPQPDQRLLPPAGPLVLGELGGLLPLP